MDLLSVEWRVVNRECEVWWSGFRSTTTRLQQAGWEIAAEESIYDRRVRLMLRNRDMQLYALTDTVEHDYYAPQQRPLVFQVVVAAPRMQCRVQPEIGAGWADFKQIDAMPQFIAEKVQTPEDLKIFATPLTRTEEIIAEPQTVMQMLEKIREMQAPEQARIRHKQRLEARREGLSVDAIPRQRFHAQIISLAEAA